MHDFACRRVPIHPIPYRIGIALAAFVLGGQYSVVLAQPAGDAVAAEMGAAADKWLNSLTPSQRDAARFPFKDQQRTDWQFVPKERTGVSLRAMEIDQRRAAHDLIQTALSNQGYLKATSIMSLEQVLRTLETERPDVEEFRHPAKYWLAVYGDPQGDAPWGWRVEGHHLSLNFSIVPGEGIAVAPMFYGANPAEVRSGARAGLRVLGTEEDLARGLLMRLDEKERRDATLTGETPHDVVTGPGAKVDLGTPAGLAASRLDPDELAQLKRLVRLLAENLCGELAQRQLAEIEQAGWQAIHFAWAGSAEPRQPHYYRLHGPTFLMEYDNTQNEANHAHLVWHSLQNDFGANLLRRHYQEAHSSSGAEGPGNEGTAPK